MCLSSTEPGGPKRCSGDTRATYESASQQVLLLERQEQELTEQLGSGATPEQVQPVSFAAKEGRIEAMRAEIDKAIEDLGSGPAWQEYMEFHSRFHQYSLNNQLLIKMQRPDATRVAGYQAWKKLGRSPRAGEKGIWVQAPMFRKEIDKATGEERETLIGFRPVPVFDVAQTHGKELPPSPAVAVEQVEGAAPPAMVDELTAAATKRGFPVSYKNLEPELGGYTDFTARRVVINSSASEAQKAKTLAHELAHIHLGHEKRVAEYHTNPGGQRPDMEVEAESLAYMVSRSYGLNTGSYSFGYIDGWAQGNKERVKATAEIVIKGAASLFKELGR